MRFGEFAREKRQIAKMSQSQVAQGMGLTTRGAVQKLEAGIVQWRLDQVFSFCRVLGIRTSQLIKEFEEKSKGGDEV